MRINREEIFGPMVSVLRARNYDQGLAFVNDNEMDAAFAPRWHDRTDSRWPIITGRTVSTSPRCTLDTTYGLGASQYDAVGGKALVNTARPMQTLPATNRHAFLNSVLQGTGSRLLRRDFRERLLLTVHAATTLSWSRPRRLSGEAENEGELYASQ